MSTSGSNPSLFELDRELDLLLDQIQEQSETNAEGCVPPMLIEQFQYFCHAYNQKVDRIGHFLLALDARAAHCRGEAARLTDRARVAENKAARTKNMVLYYLESRGLKKVEGLEVTLRKHANSQPTLVIHDETQLPLTYQQVEAKVPGSFWQSLQAYLPDTEKQKLNSYVQHSEPSASSIKAAISANESVPGVELKRNNHLRVE
ncbi:MAG: hypothetical protein BGO25_03275 [Acidobacteriales bacterium 59-55]|nr:siphovirus Gp157 family protein [Terriglobales bacterium]OJV40182.1 MAG: hypothetical protein BGO25_03275 [Acidobacteriales bacterium 59-55]